jgi:hypothetical protein
MKDPMNAPMYAVMYKGLTGIAREHGYALAIHGSLDSDLDLIAVPWVKHSSKLNVLVDALSGLIEAVYDAPFDKNNPERKPHGRIAYNLYLDNGCKVDLSIVSQPKTKVFTHEFKILDKDYMVVLLKEFEKLIKLVAESKHIDESAVDFATKLKKKYTK